MTAAPPWATLSAMNETQKAKARAFIEAIVDHPSDPGHRIEFADWLDSLGLPHAARCQRSWAGPTEAIPREAAIAIETHVFERSAGLD